MDISNKQVVILILIVGFFILTGFPTSHPTTNSGGYTGAPQDGVCTSCHSSQDENLSGEFEVTGFLSVVIKGETYPINIEVRNPDKDAVRAGFQLVSLEEDLSNGGNLQAVSEETSRKIINGKHYLGHNPAINFDADGIARWTGSWTIEDNDEGELTLYGVAMIGSGGDGNRNDKALFKRWTVTVMDSTAPIVSTIEIIDSIACAGEASGSLLITASGGKQPYTYNWSNGDTTHMIQNIAAGTYFATTTDHEGNTSIDTIILDEPDSLIIENLHTQDATSADLSDGIISLTVMGGSPPYQAIINEDTIAISEDSLLLTNLDAGEYQIEVIDRNDCHTSTSVEISFPSSNKNTSDIDYNLYPNPTGGIIILENINKQIPYKIFDLTGKVLKNGILDQDRIDVSSFSTGIYVLTLLTNEGNILVKKFSKL